MKNKPLTKMRPYKQAVKPGGGGLTIRSLRLPESHYSPIARTIELHKTGGPLRLVRTS